MLGDSIPHSQVGFGLGLYALFPMPGPLRLRTELPLSNRGGGWDEVVYGIDYTDTTFSTLIPVGTSRRVVDLTYIELPVMLSLPLRSQGTVIPHIEGGASAGLRILGGFQLAGLLPHGSRTPGGVYRRRSGTTFAAPVAALAGAVPSPPSLLMLSLWSLLSRWA